MLNMIDVSKEYRNGQTQSFALRNVSLSIPRRAFVAARKGIEEGEATHKVDKED